MWRALVYRLVNVGADSSDTQDLRQRKRILTAALWAAPVPTSASAIILAFYDLPWAAAALTAHALLMLATLAWVDRRPKAYEICVHVVALSTCVLSVILTVLFGGLSSSGANMVWGLVAPLAATIGIGRKEGRRYLGIFIASTLISLVVPRWIPPLYTMPVPNLSIGFALITVGLFIFLTLDYFIRQRDSFQRRSDNLLRNILPGDIAERLKHRQTMIAEHFDEASVLFADVVGFTSLSAELSPDELVALLDEVFTVFDGMVARSGLEKIKTIGDCYMVAAGIPRARPDHAAALARLALEMRDCVAARRFRGRHLAFRMGIHSGPLVAGVIGRKKFTYDLWGDTVNTASRMESHGLSGAVQITEATCELIRSSFVCEPRASVYVKGKGDMKVWHVIRELETDDKAAAPV